MAAYFIGDIEVTDPEAYQEYRNNVRATVQKYGGKTIVTRGNMQVLEGDWTPKGLVVLEFENVEKAWRWYDSDEYRPLRELRGRATKSNLILIEGV